MNARLDAMPTLRDARARLVAAAAASLLAACSGGAHDGPGAASAGPATSAPEAPASATRAGEVAAPDPRGRDEAARKLLRGDADVGALPVEATEPGATLDPSLRDQLAPRARPPQIRMAKTTVVGRLPPEVIQRIVRQNFGLFRRCYEQGLTRDPALEGTVEVHFVIAADGSTGQVTEKGSTLQDDAVKQCIVALFPKLTFPQPEGGVVKVTFPMAFSPAIEGG